MKIYVIVKILFKIHNIPYLIFYIVLKYIFARLKHSYNYIIR